jgi:HPr kinase/phosphorylase
MTQHNSELSRGLIHASAVAIGGCGILLLGSSGCGKSDLAMRLIDRGAQLIGDDYIQIDTSSSPPIINCAPNIHGKIEVRQLGIFHLPYTSDIPLRLCVNLNANSERLPARWPVKSFGGHYVPLIDIDPFTHSAPIKIEWALNSLTDPANCTLPTLSQSDR